MTIGARPQWHAEQALDAGPLRMVTLSMIADKDYLALARTSAMHVGALLCFPLAQVSDLRLAVNEACACFLDPPLRRVQQDGGFPAAPDWMELSYDRYPDELHITVRAAAYAGWPEVDELGWAVLRALVGAVHWYVHDGLGVLTLALPLPREAVA